MELSFNANDVQINWAVKESEKVCVALGSIKLLGVITVAFQLKYSSSRDSYWVDLGNSKKGKDNKWYDGAWIENREIRDALVETIVKAYLWKVADSKPEEVPAKEEVQEVDAEVQEDLDALMKAC